MTSERRFWGWVSGMLPGLLLLTGCGACLEKAFPSAQDTCLKLASIGGKSERFSCGYYAGRQVIQHYRPDITDENITTDSLIFAEAHDTVSVLHYLKDNLAIPLTIKNASVDGLLASLDAGDPVTVFLPGDTFASRGLRVFGTTFLLHCIVVVGHSAPGGELFFYSDGEGPYAIRRETFVHHWARVDNLCIIRTR
jgi:hypothetical protein